MSGSVGVVVSSICPGVLESSFMWAAVVSLALHILVPV